MLGLASSALGFYYECHFGQWITSGQACQEGVLGKLGRNDVLLSRLNFAVVSSRPSFVHCRL